MSEIINDKFQFQHFQSYIRSLLLLVVLIYLSNDIYADDPGITKVRLIQEADSVYSFEVDLAQSVLWAIKPPVLPERFRISDTEFENQSGWITIKSTIITTGEPFTSSDEILLPWTRNGADITVQWLDGKTYKGLYRRTLNGIHIPLSELMPVQKTTMEVIQQGFIMGVKHLPFKIIHLLLILTLVWAFPSMKIFKYLLAVPLGQMLAMPLAELGAPGIDLLLCDLFFVLTILLLSYSITYQIRFRYLGILLVGLGILHGLSFAQEMNVLELQSLQRIQSLFSFNIALDLGHYLFAAVILLFVSLLRKRNGLSKWFPIATGSISILILLLIFNEHVIPEKSKILNLQTSRTAITYKMSAKAPPIATRQVQRGTGLMKTPVMMYLSVEPYEVRQEILIQAGAAAQHLNLDLKEKPFIPAELQPHFKKELQEAIIASDTLYINNQLTRPSDVITNFVTLSRGGVATRPIAVKENINDAIIGMTVIYDIESFPDSIQINWNYFPDTVKNIEASALDPHGTFTKMLTPEENSIRWKSRLKGYQVSSIEAIEVENQPKPLISFLLWMGVLVVAVFQMINKKTAVKNQWMVIVLVLSFLSYPFLRFQVNFPFLPRGKPSSERAGILLNDLLSNVYKAFDRRNEDAVYDRLALSVSEEQLTEIYMQNRKSMALENRGGARANVDDVSIEELYSLNRDKNTGYVADTRWTVRGSVNHFGHTHYRQNQYRALVTFGIDNNHWKINNIEILDTRRLY